MPKLGHSTTFAWNSQTVGELTSIGGVSLSADSIETTTHQSADYYKEFIPGLIDAGEFPIEGNFKQDDTNGQVAMLTDFNARTTRACTVTFPDSIATWTFNGFLTGYEIGAAESGGVIPFSATIKITGKPTLAVATSTGMSAVALSNSAVLAPTFAIGTFDYVATVLTGVSSITVTPTAVSHTITVTANGLSQTVVSGSATSAITLGSAGSVTPITVTVAETNKAPKTYTFRIFRA